MKHVSAYRVAAVLLVLYCAAHTLGGMLSESSMGAESDAVFAAMKSTEFDFNGAQSTWYGFWFGFGLMVSIFLLFSAVVAWCLDRVPAESWPAVSTIAWALVAAHVATTVLSWMYFFAGPGSFGITISALTAWGALKKARSSPAPVSTLTAVTR